MVNGPLRAMVNASLSRQRGNAGRDRGTFGPSMRCGETGDFDENAMVADVLRNHVPFAEKLAKNPAPRRTGLLASMR